MALTDSDKIEINQYLFKIAAPVGALLTLFGAALGYIGAGIARIDVTKEYNPLLATALQSATEAKAYAAAAQKSAEASSNEAAALLDKAKVLVLANEKTAVTSLQTLENLKNAIGGKWDEVAKELVKIDAFRSVIAPVAQESLAKFDERLTKIEGAIFRPLDAPTPAPSGTCPPGTYAVSIAAVGVPGGRAGYLESVSIQCRTLRFERPN